MLGLFPIILKVEPFFDANLAYLREFYLNQAFHLRLAKYAAFSEDRPSNGVN